MDQLFKDIASNFYFEWQPEAKILFDEFSPELWSVFKHNPHRFLAFRIENPLRYEKRFSELVNNPDYLARFESVKAKWHEYFNPKKTWISEHYPELQNKTVAYFSMEYGIETLKIYSGGLGILSGDHVRGASDLGLKLVAVGLFYLQGYYKQKVTAEGDMQVSYDSIIPPHESVRAYLPLESVKCKGSNNDLIVKVPIAERKVSAKVWRAKVGRVELLLLDTNLSENNIHDRHITRRLYASEKQHSDERKRRFEQEIVLGIGGAMALEGAGYEPKAYHLNEGHVALAAIEVVRQKMQHENIGFKEAKAAAAKAIGFTTHTPVMEGNERFEEGLVRNYLTPYLSEFLLPEEQEIIFNCGRNRENMFDMTKLSLLFTEAYRKWLSKLHGEVCRHMLGWAWGDTYKNPDQVPIGSITNGVHVDYWRSPSIELLVKKAGGHKNIDRIPDVDLWNGHLYRKQRLIVEVRERVAYYMIRTGMNPTEIQKRTSMLLDLDAFSICFARRFAGYKRVTWLLEDEDRLFSFLESSYKKYKKPIQILFAGKPHPNNEIGIGQIHYIHDVSNRLQERAKARDFKAQILFIEGYDIDLARRLSSGNDIWLNNPIRPLEASGTSGMKAGMNGVINVSIPDGWVIEGVRSGENGWLFGKGDEAHSNEDRDELFQLLEGTILPMYFERPAGLTYSPKWVKLMKNSISTITEQFSIERMLIEYVEKMYLPAVRSSQAVSAAS